MDTDDRFVFHIKTEDIVKDIGEDLKARFDTSNFELDRPLPKGKIGLIKDELSGQIMKEFIGLRIKTYSYL